MTNDRHQFDDAAVAAEVSAARQEYADEEAEAAEAEAALNAAALDVPLSMRITRTLDAQLRQRAAAEHISPSALVRRLLHEAFGSTARQVLTVQEVEEIARRVMRESA
ncbi:MAG: hypothetical protein ACR2G2_13690 [Pseudonocardia sp.]